MKYLPILFAAMMAWASPSLAQEEDYPMETEAIETEGLANAAGRLRADGNNICSVFKIAPKTFMTAKHCITNTHKEYSIEYDAKSPRLYVRSMVVPVAEKVGGNKMDWAVLSTFEDNTVRMFELGCDIDVKLGMKIGTVGFPASSELTLGIGYISSVSPVDISNANADYTMSMTGAPGASGSVVFEWSSEKIIGIFTEGYAPGGYYAKGIESINSTVFCLEK